MIQVESALNSLAQTREDRSPLILTMPRIPGQKETRIAHLLCGEPEYLPPSFPTSRTEEEGKQPPLSFSQTIEELRAEIADLRREFNEFKSKF
jgi:uncharacterized protein YceH (UPF0502 family)